MQTFSLPCTKSYTRVFLDGDFRITPVGAPPERFKLYGRNKLESYRILDYSNAKAVFRASTVTLQGGSRITSSRSILPAVLFAGEVGIT